MPLTVKTGAMKVKDPSSGNYVDVDMSLGVDYAPINSPEFAGMPKAPTATSETNNTQIATTAFVQGLVSTKAPINSPNFQGTPLVPTPPDSDKSGKVVNTNFLNSFIMHGALPSCNLNSFGTYGAWHLNRSNTYQNSPSQLGTLLVISLDTSYSGIRAQIIFTGDIYARYGNVASGNWTEWKKLAFDELPYSTAPVTRGNVETGTLDTDRNLIYKTGNICTCSARIYSMTGMPDRTNFRPFTIPAGYRPRAGSRLACVYRLNDGRIIPTTISFSEAGNLYSSYDLSASDAELLGQFELLAATWVAVS